MTWVVKTRCYVDGNLLLSKDLATWILCYWAPSHANHIGLTSMRWVGLEPSTLLFCKDSSTFDGMQVLFRVGKTGSCICTYKHKHPPSYIHIWTQTYPPHKHVPHKHVPVCTCICICINTHLPKHTWIHIHTHEHVLNIQKHPFTEEINEKKPLQKMFWIYSS